MFHRVKSDVQVTSDIENKQEVAKGYVREEQAQATTRQEPRISVSMSKNEERSEAPTYRDNKLKPKEDINIMRKSEEAAPVQGKYVREEDRSADASSRGGYQPSVARPASAYAGGGTPYSGATTYAAPAAPDIYSGNDRTLTIGRGINMSGEIDACDHLMVEGTVEAALKGAKLLEIAECGTFYGTVEIEEATIAGRFEGDITVNGRLTLKSTGVITGSIAYRELEVEAGAILDGRMTPIKVAADPKSADKYRAGSDASAMAKAKELVSKKDNREPANTESALFSKARASYNH